MNDSAAPAWLLEREPGLCPCGCIGKRQKTGFVEKTINGAARVLRETVFADDTATRSGWLQRLDPRVKLVSLVALLLAVSLTTHVASLVAIYAAIVAVAATARIGLPGFLKRVWLFVPVFTAVVVIPATLDVVTPGTVVLSLGPVGVTSQGLTAAALIIARVASSVSLVVLVTTTTRWNDLLASLRTLRLPRVFVVVIAMAYRYLLHLLNAVTEMYTARRARTAGTDGDLRSGRAFVAASAGALFGKAHALSEEVHMAMVARGYTGETRTLTALQLRRIDVVGAVVALATAAMLIGVDRAF